MVRSKQRSGCAGQQSSCHAWLHWSFGESRVTRTGRLPAKRAGARVVAPELSERDLINRIVGRWLIPPARGKHLAERSQPTCNDGDLFQSSAPPLPAGSIPAGFVALVRRLLMTRQVLCGQDPTRKVGVDRVIHAGRASEQVHTVGAGVVENDHSGSDEGLVHGLCTR
jgi:hypothetical protein